MQKVRLDQIAGTLGTEFADLQQQLDAAQEGYFQVEIATTGQTDFTVNKPFRVGKNALNVFLNGLRVNEGEVYDEIDSQTIRFKAPLEAGEVVFFYIPGVGSGYVSPDGHTHVFRERPLGELDGENREFALRHLPVPDSEQVYLNGQLLFPGLDYTIEGKVITLVGGRPAPEMDEIIVVSYVR